MKSLFDKDFFEFLGARKSAPVWVAAILIVLLLSFGGMGKGDVEKVGPSDEAAEMCSMVSGVGECRVMITYDGDDRVFAVAILCEGAEDVAVQSNITELICSLYGIGAHRVTILPLR